jgi:hypothetical protein
MLKQSNISIILQQEANVARFSVFPAVSLACLLLIGCAQPKPEFGNIGAGMSEAEVVQKLGKPSTIAMQGQTKYLEYESWDVDPWYGNRINFQVFFVRIINGHVESFGRRGDFNSTKNPTNDININQKIDTTSSQGTKTQPQEAFDLQNELSKLEKIKKDGLITDSEYQQIRQRLIDKAKAI